MKSLQALATVAMLQAFSPIALSQTTSFDDQTGCEKAEILWKAVADTAYETLPQWTGSEPLQLFGLATNPFKGPAREFLKVTMERTSDVMPQGRSKGIHTYGSVAKIQFRAAKNSPYSGLFRGVPCGLIRLSLATKPAEDSTVPGLAVKFLIDGKPSANFMAMYSLEGQPSYNFFLNNFSNWVQKPTSVPLKILASAFALVTSDPTKVDVNSMSKVKSDGTLVTSAAKGPQQVTLVPNKDLPQESAPHEVRETFANIPSGTVLYRIYEGGSGTRGTYIGDIVTQSSFVASKFGDENLFFRHQKVD
jgi:hypothetical protein